MTPDQIVAGIAEAETLISGGLPLVGMPAFVPVVVALGELAQLITKTLTAHAQAAAVTQVGVSAVKAEVDVEEAAKFGGK
jgi:hypothetical protein